MRGSVAFERCREFIDAQVQTTRLPASAGANVDEPRHVITISRQAGSGSHVVARELIAMLQERTPQGSRPWTMFDRDLVEKVLEDHDLPRRLAEFMPEDRTTAIADTMDELFGLHPSSRMLVRKTAETLLRLAELGNVILIGRGSNIITRNLDFALHVRLVGSLSERVRHVMAYTHVGEEVASEYVRRNDLGRSRYVKKYYGEGVEDPTLYDLVINTDRVSYEEAARIIATAALEPLAGRPDRRGAVTPADSRSPSAVPAR
jgi:cytidylate kinase